MIVETVNSIKRCYSKREIEQADQARRFYVIMGRSSKESYELMVNKGKLLNNPLTVTNFRNVEKIYG
jgi:predicted transcriptional regulator